MGYRQCSMYFLYFAYFIADFIEQVNTPAAIKLNMPTTPPKPSSASLRTPLKPRARKTGYARKIVEEESPTRRITRSMAQMKLSI